MISDALAASALSRHATVASSSQGVGAGLNCSFLPSGKIVNRVTTSKMSNCADWNLTRYARQSFRLLGGMVSRNTLLGMPGTMMATFCSSRHAFTSLPMLLTLDPHTFCLQSAQVRDWALPARTWLDGATPLSDQHTGGSVLVAS